MTFRLPRRVGVGTWSVVLVALATPSGFAQVRQLPLDAAYGTTGQKNLRQATHGFTTTPGGDKNYIEPYGAYLHSIYADFRSGASNVFLVRADDITEAVRGTFDVLVGGATAGSPARVVADRKDQRGLWLVAYLGVAGSSPPQ